MAEELLEVVTATGRPIEELPRSAVHSQGHWHQVFHCLVVRSGAPARLVLQRRSAAKSKFANCLDLTATGHLHAGESPRDGIRELREELGIDPGEHALRYVGRRLLADDGGEGLNRELVHVYFLKDDRPLSSFDPHKPEVSGLVEVAAGDLLELLGGKLAEIRATECRTGSTEVTPTTISATDLVPAIDGYWTVLAVMAERYVSGARPIGI